MTNDDLTYPRSTITLVKLLHFGLLVALAVSAFVPTSRLWGINHLFYYPTPVRVVAFAIVAAMFVPVVAEWVHSMLLRAAGAATASSRGTVVAVIAAVAAFIAFNTIRCATFLLGDGALQADFWHELPLREGLTFGGYVELIRANFQQSLALGTNVLSFLSARTAVAAGAGDPLTGVFVLYAFLGSLLVFGLFQIVRRGRYETGFGVVVVGGALLSGAIQLFFGYVEVYVPMIFFSAVYLAAAFDTMRTGRRIWLPFVSLAAAVFLHVEALLLAPSFVVLVIAGVARGRHDTLLRRIGLVVASVSAAGAVVLRSIPVTSRFFLPLLTTDDSYGIVSATHMVDMANVMLLVFPAGVLVIGAAGAGRATRDRTGDATAGARGAFSLALVSAGILFLLLFHPDLGMANDWDLYVLPVMCIAVPACEPFRRWLATLDRKQAGQLVVPALAISATIAVSWIGVNADEGRSVGRYRDVIANDRMSGAYALEILAMHERSRERRREAIDLWEQAYRRAHNPRYLVARAHDYYVLGDTLEMMYGLQNCVEDHPDYHIGRRAYLDALFKLKSYRELCRVSQDGVARFPEMPHYYFYLGICLAVQGKYEEAEAALEKSRELGAPDNILQAIDSVMADIEKARRGKTEP